MKPDLNNWTLVIVGSWNTKIFNPRWVSEKLFKDPNQKVQVLIPVVPGFPMILGTDAIDILPAEDSLTFRAKAPDDEAIQVLETKAVSALRVLEHTPVRAIGANFGFVEKEPPQAIRDLFAFGDSSGLEAMGLNVTQHQLSRTYPSESGAVNLILTYSNDELKALLNFHLPLDYPARLENSEQAVEFIDGKLLAYKNRALDILHGVYALKLEEEIDV